MKELAHDSMTSESGLNYLAAASISDG
jgi:hypothetical protein